MADAGTTQMDKRDSEVEKLFVSGLQKECLRDSAYWLNRAYMKYGEDLLYSEISEMEAPVLRRMLSTGPSVRKLCIGNISVAALKVAFDELEECPSLEYVYFRVDCEGEDIGTTLSVALKSLHTLELCCQNTGTGFARDVADYIRQNKSLRNVVVWESCGGNQGAAALIEALTVNDTLETFTLAEMELPSDTLIGFAKMLATNSKLKFVNLKGVCPVEKAKICWLLEQERYARVFERLDIVWPEQLLPELMVLIREGACYPVPSVGITSSVDDGVLQEFFDAVATHDTLEGLVFDSADSDGTFDALAEGIASVLKRTRTLQKIENYKYVMPGDEHQLLVVLDALKRNRSVKEFAMYAEFTAEIAASLSELFQVNDTLTAVEVGGNACGISITQMETILQGLRTNYTLTEVMIPGEPKESEDRSELEDIRYRNVCLVNEAAKFVISGVDTSDEAGADALKKLHSSAGLVEMVRERTGKTTEAALQEIHSALARLSL